MTLWKQRLFSRLQRPADDGEDLGGEVISINGAPTAGAADDDAGTADIVEDRGDVVTPPVAPESKETPEAPDTTSKAAPADDTKATAGIPKARFDEVNERRKTAEQELAEAQAEIARLKSTPAPTASATTTTTTPAAPAFDEVAQEQAYMDALLDGDTAKALQIRTAINANLRQQASEDVKAMQAQAARATQAQAEQDLLDKASEQAAKDFPYLDTDEGAYALGLIVAARNADVARGVPVHKALADAVANIAPRFAPAAGSTPTPVLPTTKPAVDTRTQQALERGALDSTRQPPAAQVGLGNRTDKVRVDVQSLDEAQFAALTAAEKKALRGD